MSFKYSKLFVSGLCCLVALLSSNILPVNAKESSDTSSIGTVLSEHKHPKKTPNDTNLVTVYMTRHAERPGDSNVPDLTPAGQERAQKLVPYFRDVLGKPDYIFAAKLWKKNNRAVQTAEPLSKAIEVPINDSYEAIKNDEIANEILHDPKYAGKKVLIFWHHSLMPGLAKALGAPDGSYPDPWDVGTYNLIVKIEHTKKHIKVTQIREPF